MIAYLSPTIPEDILQLNLWWRTEYQGLHFGIIMSKAYTLYMNGLSCFRDIWDPRRYDSLKWELYSPWKKSTKTTGLNLLNSTDVSEKGCATNKKLNSPHINGLAFIEARRMHHRNGCLRWLSQGI